MHRLREDAIVTVSLPNELRLSRPNLECHVLAVSANTAALEVIDKADALGIPDRVENVLLSFTLDASLIVLKGTLVVRPPPGDFRFILSDATGRLSKRATRALMTIPLTLRAAGSDSTVEGVTVDISVTGLLAECAADVSPGDAAEISMRPNDQDDPIEVAGTVRRAAPNLVAVEFDASTAKATTRRIGALVIAERRETRRRSTHRSQASAEPEF